MATYGSKQKMTVMPLKLKKKQRQTSPLSLSPHFGIVADMQICVCINSVCVTLNSWLKSHMT